MPRVRSDVRRTQPAALVLAIAVGLSAAACARSGIPSASGDVAVTQVATATPRVSQTAAGGTPIPRGPATVEISDPDLTMTLPVGWAEYPMATYRFIIDSLAKSSSPAAQAILAEHLKAIDAGAIRFAAGGPIDGASATLIVQVDSGDRSLEAAVTRLRRFGTLFTTPSSFDERPVTLAIGEAVKRVETHPVPSDPATAGVPSRTVEYIARLDDGRTLWILATGPQSATTFEALIDASVTSLRLR